MYRFIHTLRISSSYMSNLSSLQLQYSLISLSFCMYIEFSHFQYSMSLLLQSSPHFYVFHLQVFLISKEDMCVSSSYIYLSPSSEFGKGKQDCIL